jgi:hypothetical protein
MSAMRQPIVECKYSETEGDYNLINGNSTHIPNCFEFATQGDGRGDITGRWIFSKWLTQKLLIDFTPCADIAIPVTYNLIHGWLKLNLNPEPNLATPEGPFLIEQGDLQEHTAKYLQAAYEDPLAFGDKKRIKILGKKLIRGNPRVVEDANGRNLNFRQNQLITLKWTPMRKIRYNHCKDEDNVTFMQCNTGNWVPFVFWQQNPQTTTLAAYPYIKHSSRHWFTDS